MPVTFSCLAHRGQMVSHASSVGWDPNTARPIMVAQIPEMSGCIEGSNKKQTLMGVGWSKNLSMPENYQSES